MVAKLFLSCFALKVSEELSLNVLLMDFRKFPGTGLSGQWSPQKKVFAGILLSESESMGIVGNVGGAGDVIGVW